jgi:hypothetical protein
MVNPDNPVVKLCMEGSWAEFNNRIDEARRLFAQAWEAAGDPFERCIAAHYSARYQTDPQAELRYNLLALEYAGKVEGEEVQTFLPSLYLNLGRSYERVNDPVNAAKYYNLAAGLGAIHQPGPNDRWG